MPDGFSKGNYQKQNEILARIPQMDARFFTRRSVIYSIIQ